MSTSHAPRIPSTALLVALAAVVVGAYVTVWLVGLDLAVRPPLPARLQADDVTGLVSLIGDLTARLSAIGALGFCVAALGSGMTEGTLSERGHRFAAAAGRLAQVWFAASVLNTFANPAYVNGVSESLFKVGICLPAGPWVTDDHVRYIVDREKFMAKVK